MGRFKKSEVVALNDRPVQIMSQIYQKQYNVQCHTNIYNITF